MTQFDHADHFYYFAYGSCMCPVDLSRSLQEKTHPYIVGVAALENYRLGFFRFSRRRQCGVLDIVPVHDLAAPAGLRTVTLYGVLYRLPWHLSEPLDRREEGYGHHAITVHCQGRQFPNTRTYTVLDKLHCEQPPDDRYFEVVMRGAITCGLPEAYCWQLFDHIRTLQQLSSAS